MAIKPISIDAFEIKTLLIDKLSGLVGYMAQSPPNCIDTVAVGEVLKRVVDLHLALKEAVAALPKPNVNAAADAKRA